jgi:hypothetical protein
MDGLLAAACRGSECHRVVLDCFVDVREPPQAAIEQIPVSATVGLPPFEVIVTVDVRCPTARAGGEKPNTEPIAFAL